MLGVGLHQGISREKEASHRIPDCLPKVPLSKKTKIKIENYSGGVGRSSFLASNLWGNMAKCSFHGPFHKYLDLVDLGWSAGIFVFGKYPTRIMLWGLLLFFFF